jgi:hypothetical protein
MIREVSFKGVFTIDEHYRVAVELTELDKSKRVYTCKVSRSKNDLPKIELKEQNTKGEKKEHEQKH